jgi:hypothetical protein
MGYDIKEKNTQVQDSIDENYYGLAELTFDEQHLAHCLKTVLSRKLHKFRVAFTKTALIALNLLSTSNI